MVCRLDEMKSTGHYNHRIPQRHLLQREDPLSDCIHTLSHILRSVLSLSPFYIRLVLFLCKPDRVLRCAVKRSNGTKLTLPIPEGPPADAD